jgi:DNA polymerase III delta subunit
MQNEKSPLYLFIGEDAQSKNLKIKDLKETLLARELADFNFDVMYASSLTLKELQEKMLFLPVKAKRRMVVVKEAQKLKQDVRDFLLEYAKKPLMDVFLVFDAQREERGDAFLDSLARYAQVFRFKDTAQADTFTLSRSINSRKSDSALRILNQLLENGERPERLLGGLRYAVEKDALQPLEKRRRLKLLLVCDIDIKTGRLKPEFALERLVISLCGAK